MGCCWSGGFDAAKNAVSFKKCVPVPPHTLHEPEYLRRHARDKWGESWIVFCDPSQSSNSSASSNLCATKYYRRGEWSLLMERRRSLTLDTGCRLERAWLSVNDVCPKRLWGDGVAIHAWREGLVALLEKAEDMRRNSMYV
jgi:hypothetical protein